MPDHEVIPAFAESVIPHVGTYRRVLPVTLERMYENTLDWEHLPYVHASSFAAISCLDSGNWGWRAEVTNPRGAASVIELRLDRNCRRWITRTLSGVNQGSEIWTHAFPIGGDRVDIVVDFFVPEVVPSARAKVGAAYATLYSQLYDEDVAMMVGRQKQLDRRVPAAVETERELNLGSRAELQLPSRLSLAGRDYVLVDVGGELAVYPALCPHQLGPLHTARLEFGIVACPWHGYRFDVLTGECVSGQSCRFSQMPQVAERDGEVVVTAVH